MPPLSVWPVSTLFPSLAPIKITEHYAIFQSKEKRTLVPLTRQASPSEGHTILSDLAWFIPGYCHDEASKLTLSLPILTHQRWARQDHNDRLHPIDNPSLSQAIHHWWDSTPLQHEKVRWTTAFWLQSAIYYRWYINAATSSPTWHTRYGQVPITASLNKDEQTFCLLSRTELAKFPCSPKHARRIHRYSLQAGYDLEHLVRLHFATVNLNTLTQIYQCYEKNLRRWKGPIVALQAYFNDKSCREPLTSTRQLTNLLTELGFPQNIYSSWQETREKATLCTASGSSSSELQIPLFIAWFMVRSLQNELSAELCQI